MPRPRRLAGFGRKSVIVTQLSQTGVISPGFPVVPPEMPRCLDTPGHFPFGVVDIVFNVANYEAVARISLPRHWFPHGTGEPWLFPPCWGSPLSL